MRGFEEEMFRFDATIRATRLDFYLDSRKSVAEKEGKAVVVAVVSAAE